MTTMNAIDDAVHLVGSVPLESSEQVFRTVCAALGPHIARIPDGETGERTRWIYFQRTMLEQHPAIELDPTVPPLRLTQWDGKLLREMPLLRFKEGTDVPALRFDTGYDLAALHSWEVFRRLRHQGVIPPGTRFQVSLPTPMASGFFYISHKALADYLKVYERALLSAVSKIVEAIPAQDLAIQYDVCQEVLVFEDYFPQRPDDYKEQVFSQLARLGNAVPDRAELGYHLCYGTPYEEHLVQPRDMGVMVEIANGMLERIERQVDFLHVPVPKKRFDEAYFKPLETLGKDVRRLYLGLIHHDDEAGNRRRIEAASRIVSAFGIASECGWGRGAPERVSPLLEAHRHAVALLPQKETRTP